MSFSNPDLTNPAKHFFQWKGGEGKLQFYDKEKKVNISVPLPFEFIPIDQLATITGYSKQAQNGYYSNEVRNSAKEEFNVKIKGQTVFAGLYKNEQGVPQVPKGANYTASIYIVHKNRAGEYITGNLKANGSALSAWIEFSKNNIVGNGKVLMTKGEKQTSPVGDFYAPEFKYESLSEEDYAAANNADKELQIYLSQYLAAKPEDAPADDWPSHDDVGNATPDQVADFEKRKADKLSAKDDNDEDISLYASIAESEAEDQGFDPSEIPFY